MVEDESLQVRCESKGPWTLFPEDYRYANDIVSGAYNAIPEAKTAIKKLLDTLPIDLENENSIVKLQGAVDSIRGIAGQDPYAAYVLSWLIDQLPDDISYNLLKADISSLQMDCFTIAAQGGIAPAIDWIVDWITTFGEGQDPQEYFDYVTSEDEVSDIQYYLAALLNAEKNGSQEAKNALNEIRKFWNDELGNDTGEKLSKFLVTWDPEFLCFQI